MKKEGIGEYMMIDVKSEIMPLKKVLLHRPGNELLNVTPDSLQKLLFEDIPYLKGAREEHDDFVRILKMYGVEIVYLVDLMTEVLDISFEIKEKFVKQFVYEAGIKTPKYKNSVIELLMGYSDNRELVLKTMEGININELYAMEKDLDHSLVDLVLTEDKFLAQPMPNLVYTRDNFSSIGNGISLNKMNVNTRDRENIYTEYIFDYHPEYKNIVRYYDRYKPYCIEGGDILVLNEHVLLVGISERTSCEAVEHLANNVFKDVNNSFDTIIALDIPKKRSCIHLDTVLTQVDYDKFVYYPGMMDSLKIFEIKEDIIEGIKVREISDNLENILEKCLERDITLIPCGGGDRVIADREQWNNGVNLLCIEPGVVISYERNNITNALLRRYGVKVLEIDSSELSRGRGGTRCLSMPLIRKEN
jgi:arginine deiminase